MKPIEFTDLEQFVLSHKNWKDLLSKQPYSLTVKNVYDKYYMFSYLGYATDFNISICRACRGCVYEIHDDCISPVCLPYTKFTNYGERPIDDKRHDWSTSYIMDKLDGSMVKAVKYDGEWLWFLNNSAGFSQKVSNGKTTFGDSIKDALAKYGMTMETFIDLPENTTLMFELISPDNRIVCKYDECDLIFHGVRNSDGVEEDVEEFKAKYNLPFSTPLRKAVNSYEEVMDEIAKIDGKNKEGFVVVDKNFHRMKIKCRSYLELHRLKDIVNTEKKLHKYVVDNKGDDVVLEEVEDMKNRIRECIAKYERIVKYVEEFVREHGENEAEIGRAHV